MTEDQIPLQRSRNMAAIKGKDTKPEVYLRKLLFSEGIRYRKNVRTMPGCPDLWLSKYRTVVFVNGCFWHRHRDCQYAYTPKTRYEFWQKKFEQNIERDLKVRGELFEKKIKVLTVWECTIRKMQKSEDVRESELKDIIGFLNSETLELEL